MQNYINKKMPLTPNQGPYGGGTLVVIDGSNLGDPIAVYFGGNLGTSLTPGYSDQLTVVSPAGAGVVELVVETSSGKSNPKPYYYIRPPFISELSQTHGATEGTNTITISGIGLSTVSSVKFDDSYQTAVNVINDGSITVEVPPGTAGTIDVSVITSGGVASGLEYTYVDPPTISTPLSPDSGSEFGGTVITLTGTNLTTTTSVKVDDVLSNYIVVNDTTLTVITPAGTAGTVGVAIKTAGGVAESKASFTYGALPTI